MSTTIPSRKIARRRRVSRVARAANCWICNKKGLHARATAKFVHCVDAFEADVRGDAMRRDGRGDLDHGHIDAGARAFGSTITVSAAGPQAAAGTRRDRASGGRAVRRGRVGRPTAGPKVGSRLLPATTNRTLQKCRPDWGETAAKAGQCLAANVATSRDEPRRS